MVSCSLNDIYSSSLSSSIPSSRDQVRSLIKWRTNHTPRPKIDKGVSGRTCIWRNRWLFIGRDHCCYYDPPHDQWYGLPLLPSDAFRYRFGMIPSVHYDHLYVYTTADPALYIYTENQQSQAEGSGTSTSTEGSSSPPLPMNDGRWQQVHTMNNRQRKTFRLISSPLPSNNSHSRRHLISSSGTNNNNKSIIESKKDEQSDDGRFTDDVIMIHGRLETQTNRYVPSMEYHSHRDGLTVVSPWLNTNNSKTTWVPSWTHSRIMVLNDEWLLFIPEEHMLSKNRFPALCHFGHVYDKERYRWFPVIPSTGGADNHVVITGQDNDSSLGR
jgi:hypothetical protein